MKKVFLFSFIIVCVSIVNAQVPNQFNYQAVARNSLGQSIPNANINLRITILDGSATGTNVYSETRQTTTNQLGLFTAAIGGPGAVSTTGNFNTIDWSTGKKFIKVEADPLGGNNFSILGNTEMLSVPYALYAVNGKIGPVGPSNVLNIGTVTTGATGSTASASITGISPSQILNLGLPTGASGKNSLIKTTPEPSGANCVAGGSKIETGVDVNGNNILDAGEVTNTNYTCNGDVNNGWKLTGNTGTNPANNFIGTTDAQPLRFRVNNLWAGELHTTNANIFLGIGAGQANTIGAANTAIGDHSLFSNITGSSNTAHGFETLYFNNSGEENTAIGIHALEFNTSGNNNTANGSNTLRSNTTGNNNTATGRQALYTNTTGSFNTASGVDALLSNITGNNNLADGYQALYLNSTGDFNTATGSKALYNNTTGDDNTANGASALYFNTTGLNNTANGAGALGGNTTGNDNTATGKLALAVNTTGNKNTANGASALFNNSIGINNTANGFEALYSNTLGINNTATGLDALHFNIIGSLNTANGQNALRNNIGTANTAVGANALSNNIDGNFNIGIGYNSGTFITTPNIFNTISIGNNGYLNSASNQAIIGNNTTTVIGGRVGWSNFSDARIKNTITEDVKGLDFILKLRPVTYHISSKAITEVTGNKETADYAGKYDGEKIKYSGFLAQEVEQAAKASGYDFSGYTKPENAQQLYTIRYAEFVVPLVKAMQEQQSIIKKQQQQIDLLEKRLAALEIKK